MNESNKKSEVLDNKCPHCDAKINYNPLTGTFICDFCRKETTLEEMKKYQNASNQKNNESVSEENIDEYDDYIVYKCKNCGAEIITEEETTATFCPYCRNTAILKNKLSGKFTPEVIIPFEKTKKEAIENFKKLAQGKLLIKNDFIDTKNIEKIKGIYIPFWFHTFKAEGSLSAVGTIITNYSKGLTEYCKTNKYKLYREGYVTYTDVPTNGSKRFPNSLIESIQPYDYSKLVKYNHAYLSGFYAERYNTQNDTKETIEPKIIKETANQLISDTERFDSKTILTNNIKITDHKIKYGLLPIYMLNIKYGKKTYNFVMNGQNGKYSGTLPIDIIKTFLTALSIFISFLLLFLIVSFVENNIPIKNIIISSLILTVIVLIPLIITSRIKKDKINPKNYIKPKDLVIKKTTNELIHSHVTTKK